MNLHKNTIFIIILIMKNKIFTIFLLFLILFVFGLLVSNYKDKHEVIGIKSSTEIIIDFNNNGSADNEENVCIDNIESFSLEPQDTFYKKYSQKLNLSKLDMINLGYLAKEFAQKNIMNKKVQFKPSKNENSSCKYGSVYIDGTNYSDMLSDQGFGIINGEIANIEKFQQNLEISKKLDLVILNHHSYKYHKLDCEYGNKAHDKVIIPRKQLPKGTSPCHYCHNINNKKQTKSVNYKILTNLNRPALNLFNGDIALYKFDYTKNLKPNSKCNTDVCKLIVHCIDEAKNGIDIAIYGYENIPAITSALEKAKSRGVDIRFVYDESPDPSKTFYKGNDIIKNIASQSKSDRTSNEAAKLMHNKFIIFDKNKVITGSMNYSATGLSGYDANDVIVINSTPIAMLYGAEFEQMLNGKFHNSKIRNNLPNKFILGNSEIEIYFSPKDKSASRIVQLIKNSKRYIYIPTFLITHSAISDALIEAKKRSIDIKIIIDANSVNTRNTKHQILRDNGILLKAENYAGKLHSKTMIIDDEYIVIGSMNFSNSGENKNDENMLVIKNEQFAKNYKEFFLYLWGLIPDKYLKSSPRAESYDSIGSCQDCIDNNFDGKIDSDDDGCKKHK